MATIQKILCNDCGNEDASIAIYDNHVDKGERLVYVFNKQLKLVWTDALLLEIGTKIHDCFIFQDIYKVVGCCLGECDDFDVDVSVELQDGRTLNIEKNKEELSALVRTWIEQN